MTGAAVGRALRFFVGALACALLTGFAAILTIDYTLPRTDLAYGQGVLQSLRDPFVLTVWLTFTLGAALIAFPIALWTLWRVQLAKAVPLVFLVSVVTAVVSAFYFAPSSAPAALLVASLVMVWCRYHEPWRMPGPFSSSSEGGDAA